MGGYRATRLLALLACAACGRVSFDPRSDAGGGGVDAVPDPCGAGGTLVACFPFDGDLADGTGNGNIPTGTGVTYVPGRRGQALAAGGPCDVHIPDRTTLRLATVTLDAWVSPSSTPVGRAVIVDHDLGYALFLRDGQLASSFQLETGFFETTTTAIVPIDVWTHVAVIYDGATVTLWRDGAVVMSEPHPGSISVASANGTQLGAGFPFAEPFVGAIDDLRIWSGAVACAADGSC